MKIVFIYIIIICCVYNANSEIKSARVHINTNVQKHYVHPEIYGGFLEFLLHYINGPKGIHAQEFLDRGFDWKNDSWNFSRHWDMIDTGKYVIYSIHHNGYNKRGEYFIGIENKSNQFKGASQHVYLNDSVSHHFYVYAKTPTHAELKIRLLSNNEVVFSHDFGKVSSSWQKFEIEIPPISNIHELDFQIGTEAEGFLQIDESSLMPANNINGLRKEYFEMFRQWRPGILRYPGGCFADSRDVLLKNCIGDIDQRKAPLIAWPTTSQRMDFGADEFLRLCKTLGIEPHITVNYAEGSPEEAAAWVEYCNGDTNTYWGMERAKNGHPEPYNVKYFEVGNEQWENQKGYAHKYKEFYKQMKEVDSSIHVMISGNHWNGKKDIETLYSIVEDYSEIYGFHPAFRGVFEFEDDHLVYQTLVGMPHLYETSFYESMIWELKRRSLYPKVKLSASEWWLDYATPLDWTLDTNIRNASLESGLFSASFVNAMVRSAEYFVSGARTFGMGLNRCYIKDDGKRYFTKLPALEAMSLLRNHSGDSLIHFNMECERYNLPNYWVFDIPYLDMQITESKDSVFLTMLNRYSTDTLFVTIDNSPYREGSEGRHYSLWSKNLTDAVDADKIFEMPVIVKEIVNQNRFELIPHSLNVFAFSKTSKDTNSQVRNDKPYYIFTSSQHDYLEVNSFKDNIENYELYDIYGNLISSGYCNAAVLYIDLIDNSSGIYFLKFKLSNSYYTEKIYKLK